MILVFVQKFQMWNVWSPSVQGIGPLPHKLNTSAQEQCETTKIPMLMWSNTFNVDSYVVYNWFLLGHLICHEVNTWSSRGQCWNWPKGTGGSAAEMFKILPRDWSLWPIFTQKWAFVDLNWGVQPPPDNSNPVRGQGVYTWLKRFFWFTFWLFSVLFI